MGDDKRLIDETSQTQSVTNDKVENEGKKETDEASMDALDWSDKNQLIEKDEFKTNNTQPETIRTEEFENGTLDGHARQEDTRRIRFDIMTVPPASQEPVLLVEITCPHDLNRRVPSVRCERGTDHTGQYLKVTYARVVFHPVMSSSLQFKSHREQLKCL